MTSLPPPTPVLAPGDAVLLIDPQNDFCPGGSLAVADGSEVMPVLSTWAYAAEAAGLPVFVSRDWHPSSTTHFSTLGGLWPPHCVRGTPGAAFHPDLQLPASATILSKGIGETEDAYSAFQARDQRGWLLPRLLQERNVTHLFVMGLATDYCVKESALSAIAHHMRVTLVLPGCRAVNIQPHDGERALAAMVAAGVALMDGAGELQTWPGSDGSGGCRADCAEG